ncbi:MAG: hypothetical protein IT292_05100 [Deltaproteobacteria bacterium]|nr:hypothetical protein [Deltaproteobacteria bacterium]
MVVRGRMTTGIKAVHQEEDNASFKEFAASSLYCPQCKQAMPVRAKVLLVLADGDLIDYCCKKCGTSLGTRKGGGS